MKFIFRYFLFPNLEIILEKKNPKEEKLGMLFYLYL